MSEIPEDIAAKAKAVLYEVDNWDCAAKPELEEAEPPRYIVIARALLAERMAERERCAKLVDCSCINPICDLKEAADRIRDQ